MMSGVTDRLGYILKTQETPECLLPKLKVAGSNPVSRSKKIRGLANSVKSFFVAFTTFVSVWQEKHPEKMCAFLNVFETQTLQKGWPYTDGAGWNLFLFICKSPGAFTQKDARWASNFIYLSLLFPFLLPINGKDS